MAEEKEMSEVIVLCHGCFDIFHIGHLMHLQEARKLGSKLIVTVSLDEHVGKPGRPIFNHHYRRSILASLRCVDEARLSPEASGVWSILRYRPDFYVKGCDYTKTGINAAEKAACDEVGAVVWYTQTPKFSSTELVPHLKGE